MSTMQKYNRVFAAFEGLGLRVGTIWLNSTDLEKLRKHPDDQFAVADPQPFTAILAAIGAPGLGSPESGYGPAQPGTMEGFLWGAEVRSASIVLAGHAIFAPAGMYVRWLDQAACIKL